MTGLAYLTGINMSCRFWRRNNPVVTSYARFTGGAVIKHHFCPVDRIMANITGFSGRKMRRTFTGRDHAIVTAFTSASDFGVVHNADRCPGRINMTSFAYGTGINVCS